jgi:SAM-dependent methyltransferase
VHRAPTPAGESAGANSLHDRPKARLLDPSEPLFRALGVTGSDGRVRPSREAKLRQVEELLRALDATMRQAPGVAGTADRPLQVVDLGCGNAALTFAAYRYLSGPLGLDVRVTGVDVKAQARAHGEAVAAELGWSDRVRFVEGTAADAPVDGAGVVLALHACDTATDEALARAVRWQASVVLASPCCHHDVQRQLSESGNPPDPYGLVTRYGILRERLADVLTDALRAALLRLLGYRVDVVEFVGSVHTPRNTLIKAVRTGAAPTAEQVAAYRCLTEQWHITPRLAELLPDELAAAVG